MDQYYITLKNDFGHFILIEDDNQHISGISTLPYDTKDLVFKETDLLLKLKKQLEEYFSGKRKVFDVPTKQPVTPFQKEVYDILKDVPFGYSISYGDIAYLLDKKGASRAVGNAVGRNDILILMPCHRVLGKTSLGGFSSGLDLKRALLKLEGIEYNEKG